MIWIKIKLLKLSQNFCVKQLQLKDYENKENELEKSIEKLKKT